MSFDQKNKFSKAGTVELSDDALEGVSGGVMPSVGDIIASQGSQSFQVGGKTVTVSSGSPLSDLQAGLDHTIQSLDQTIANTEEAQNRVLAGPPKASISDPMLGNYLGLSQK